MWSKTYNKLFHDSGSWRKLTIFPNVNITPELASDLLKLNDENRPINHRTLERYTEDMKKERWRFTGDTIRISKTQRLLDGQHRLMAIVKSGMPQTFNIQSGLDNEAFQVMDTGRLRTGGDALAMKGHKDGQRMAGAIRFCILYERILRKVSKNIEGKGKLQIRNQDIVEWAEKHDMDLLSHCAGKSNILYSKARFLSPSMYTALYFIFSRKNRDEADEFMEMLSTGDGCSSTQNQAIFVLRQRLINMLNSNSALKNPNDKYALIIKAWNYWRDKRDVKQLSYNPDIETYPLAV